MVTTNTKVFGESVRTSRLQAADILLVHTKRSLWGWIIRLGTHCYWNHALMVCSAGDIEQGYDGTLVVDAKTSGNIVIRRMSEYLKRPNKYVVAVKRLEADWFQDSSQVAQIDCRRRICDIAVNEVDYKLSSRLREKINQIVRQLTVIFRFVRRKIRRWYRPPNFPWNIRPVEVKAFTCGGFIQWCYYKGVANMVQEKGTHQSRLGEVIFNSRANKRLTPFELLTTTPADLANCDKLSWKFVVKDGVVQEVSSFEDAGLLAMPA